MATKRRPKAGHASKTSFKPGQSGNPKGMTPMTDEQKKERRDAREMLKAAAPDAIALLLQVMQDESAKLDLRVKCAESVADRVFGKAAQPIEGNLGAEIKIVMEGMEDYGR